MSTTPRADAFFRPDAQEYPAAKFARQLERENTELLEALELAVHVRGTSDDTVEVLQKMEAAIAKAKGEQ